MNADAWPPLKKAWVGFNARDESSGRLPFYLIKIFQPAHGNLYIAEACDNQVEIDAFLPEGVKLFYPI